MKKIRWAIVGTGHIAHRFAEGLAVVANAELVAVVSRSIEKAETFVSLFQSGKAYQQYDQMLRKVKPDVVYIATPNDCHAKYVMRALEERIPVLCEKPIADNTEQLLNMIDIAREYKVFLMEGMWTRCFPAVKQAKQWIEDGKIGKTLAIQAHFDMHWTEGSEQNWRATIAHAGGALRDVGIYAVAMAAMVFPKEPLQIYSNMIKNEEVDVCTDLMFAYEGGKTAFLSGAFNRMNDTQVRIIGEKGNIIIGPLFWKPEQAILQDGTSIIERFQDSYEASGFQYEIMEVQNCILNHKLESSEFTLEESVKIGKIIEDIRKKWDIYYDADK